LKNLTALQKESLEKDVEGALAMRQMQLMQSLFAVVLGWFRDIELLAINGNCAYLFNQDRKSSLEQALQRGERLLIERVQKAIAEVKLAVERSTTISICIESLFLKIGTFC
jgi:DNA polymerase-3 subunit delta'